MTKKLKSTNQLDILQRFYNIKPNKWSTHDLKSLQKATGLSKHQVYKWLWDQRNLQRIED